MSYSSGYCNIGARQRRQRGLVGALGFGGAALLVAGHLAGVLPEALLAAVFVPLFVGFEWGLQAHTSFCVGLAVAGAYDFRGQGEYGKVTDPDARRDDQTQAARITLAALALATVSTGLVVFVAL